MTKTSNAMTDFVQPIAILTAICLVCAALLAYLNSVTKPIIEATEARIAEEAMSEVLAEADGSFAKLEIELPEVYDDGTENFITEIYEAENGAGYVFMITGNGYGGKGTMKLITSVAPDGSIIATKTLQHAETAGMGSKTADDTYRLQWAGITADTMGDVDAVTGATVTSGAIKEGVRSALLAAGLDPTGFEVEP